MRALARVALTNFLIAAGDISRYLEAYVSAAESQHVARVRMVASETYYIAASQLSPTLGWPYNQVTRIRIMQYYLMFIILCL
jgi:membrane protein required for beta-lactamase induction